MKLLDNARKGDVVIVWKLDRLARSIAPEGQRRSQGRPPPGTRRRQAQGTE
jgi:hypothetical protein